MLCMLVTISDGISAKAALPNLPLPLCSRGGGIHGPNTCSNFGGSVMLTGISGHTVAASV